MFLRLFVSKLTVLTLYSTRGGGHSDPATFLCYFSNVLTSCICQIGCRVKCQEYFKSINFLFTSILAKKFRFLPICYSSNLRLSFFLSPPLARLAGGVEETIGS